MIAAGAAPFSPSEFCAAFPALGGEAPQFLLCLAPHVGVARRRRGRETGTVVQRGGDGARGGEQARLLALEQEALHLAHIAVACPRQCKQHQCRERELRAQAQSGFQR